MGDRSKKAALGILLCSFPVFGINEFLCRYVVMSFVRKTGIIIRLLADVSNSNSLPAKIKGQQSLPCLVLFNPWGGGHGRPISAKMVGKGKSDDFYLFRLELWK